MTEKQQEQTIKKRGLSKSKVIILVVGIFFLIVLIGNSNKNTGNSQNISLPQSATLDSQASEVQQNNTEKTYLATEVVDGDTIKIEGGQTIRYIGIDTPETVHPSQPVGCFGLEASNKNKELVLGKRIKIEKDVSETDRYGRLLRYVWIDDIFVNDYLVRNGYAMAYTYPPDVKYSEQFAQAQKEARENNRGLWSKCQTVPTSTQQETSPPTLEITTPPSVQNSSTIICSSNAYNCTDFPTHVEAQNIFETCGGINNDVHKLDADKDGSACETLP